MIREEVGGFLEKIYTIANEHRICDSLGCEVTCAWDVGDASIPDDVEDFDAFTFWVDGGDDYVGDELNVIITDNHIYNGSCEEITFQDVKDYCSDFHVITTKPLSEYLK